MYIGIYNTATKELRERSHPSLFFTPSACSLALATEVYNLELAGEDIKQYKLIASRERLTIKSAHALINQLPLTDIYRETEHQSY